MWKQLLSSFSRALRHFRNSSHTRNDLFEHFYTFRCYEPLSASRSHTVYSSVKFPLRWFQKKCQCCDFCERGPDLNLRQFPMMHCDSEPRHHAAERLCLGHISLFFILTVKELSLRPAWGNPAAEQRIWTEISVTCGVSPDGRGRLYFMNKSYL